MQRDEFDSMFGSMEDTEKSYFEEVLEIRPLRRSRQTVLSEEGVRHIDPLAGSKRVGSIL